MKQSDIALALCRISEYKIGMQEATVLFAIGGEVGNEELTLATGLAPAAIWSRTRVLRDKGLITSHHRPAGGLYHKLTRRGKTIIDRATGEE